MLSKGFIQISKSYFMNGKFYLPGDPEKYSCLIKHKMHNKREILINEKCLDNQ